MFRPYRDRIAVVELDARMPVSRPVDIALYDPHGRPQSEQLAVEELMAQATVGKVVVYGWTSGSELERPGLPRACAVLSKGLGARELVDGLERIHHGTPLALTPPRPEHRRSLEWPGRREGLTPRESEIIALITQGLTNQCCVFVRFSHGPGRNRTRPRQALPASASVPGWAAARRSSSPTCRMLQP